MKLFYLFFALVIFSCDAKKVSYNYPDNPDYARKSRAGMLFSDKDFAVIGGKKETKDAAKDEKNPAKNEGALAKTKLWQSSIEVIGALFPIAIVDSNSGIITTEWYQDMQNSNERVKINAFVKGAAPTKENLQITIFRQIRSAKNPESWESQNREDSASPSLVTKLLQEKILKKAGE